LRSPIAVISARALSVLFSQFLVSSPPVNFRQRSCKCQQLKPRKHNRALTNKIVLSPHFQVYVARVFNCGINIDVVLSQIELLAQKCHQHDQNPFAKSVLSPTYNMLRMLRGFNEQSLVDCAVTIDHPLYFELQLMRDILTSFLFRDMEKAQATATKFKDYSETKPWTFDLVIIGFYAGLTNCYLARETGDVSRLAEAEKICDRIQKLIGHSKWNFENKLLLLKAEIYYAKSGIAEATKRYEASIQGEPNEAAKYYEASIKSAKEHKFVQEEAVACELAGYFYKEQGDETKSCNMFKQAWDAYIKWGATGKANLLPL
jgi:ATP-dependent RNA helicase DDX31/DBP7